jgi:hypothetical protein
LWQSRIAVQEIEFSSFWFECFAAPLRKIIAVVAAGLVIAGRSLEMNTGEEADEAVDAAARYLDQTATVVSIVVAIF